MRIIITLILGLLLQACSDTTPPKGIAANDTDAKYSVAETNQTSVTGFMQRLQHAARNNDTRTLTALTSFPLRVNTNRKSAFIGKREYLSNPNKYYTRKIRSVIIKSNPTKLFSNTHGIMLGNGQVWLRVYNNNPNDIKVAVLNK